VNRTRARIGVSIAVPHTSPSPCAAWPSSDRESGPVVEHRQEQRRARGQVARVHVAAVDIGRDRRQRTGPRRDAELAAERDDRDANAGEELGPLPDRRQARDLVRRIRKVVGEQPEARDRRRPAPVGRLEVEQVDLERVAGLRAVDRDRAVDLVDPDMSRVAMSSAASSAVSVPLLASSRSNSTSSPSPTVSIGGIAGSHAKWNRSRPT
jgi:hypothetical protein